jgi:hypothetical protein
VCYFGTDPETHHGQVIAVAIVQHQERVAERVESVGEERKAREICW